MVAPCYFLGCKIFQDNGFAGRMRAVKEDEEGMDLDYLEKEMEKLNDKEEATPVSGLTPPGLSIKSEEQAQSNSK